MPLTRWIARRAARRALRRLAPAERDAAVDFLRRLVSSRAQVARVLVVLSSALAGLGLVPAVVPLLGRLSDAVEGGDPLAVLVALVALVVGLVGLFDRDRRDREHEELVEVLRASPAAPRKAA